MPNLFQGTIKYYKVFFNCLYENDDMKVVINFSLNVYKSIAYALSNCVKQWER